MAITIKVISPGCLSALLVLLLPRNQRTNINSMHLNLNGNLTGWLTDGYLIEEVIKFLLFRESDEKSYGL